MLLMLPNGGVDMPIYSGCWGCSQPAGCTLRPSFHEGGIELDPDGS